MVLATGGASLEMRSDPGDGGVGLGAAQLELHVPIELFKALLAGELGSLRTQDLVQALGECLLHALFASPAPGFLRYEAESASTSARRLW